MQAKPTCVVVGGAAYEHGQSDQCLHGLLDLVHALVALIR